MITGPLCILQCPRYLASIVVQTYHSWNNFGVALWTDAGEETRMPELSVPLARCSRCEGLRSRMAVRSADERRFRLMAWWVGNDSEREKPDCPRPFQGRAWEARRRNLEALLRILDDRDDDDRLLRAEILRHLGRFADALGVLSVPVSTTQAWVAEQLRGWCERQDRQVRKLHPP